MRIGELAALLGQADLHPDSLVSDDTAAVLRDLTLPGSPTAELDHELLSLANVLGDPAGRGEMLDLMRPLAEPAALARAHALYARMDELAGAGADDERVEGVAAELAALLPDDMAKVMLDHHGPRVPWLEALTEEMSPAQTEVFRVLMRKLGERC